MKSFPDWLVWFNGFIEDTSVLIALAFILARGKVLRWISRSDRAIHESVLLGAILGVVGGFDALLPNARDPYIVSPLVASFVATIPGALPGIVALFLMLAVFCAFGTASNGFAPLSAFIVSSAIIHSLNISSERQFSWLRLFSAALLGQLAAFAVSNTIGTGRMHNPGSVLVNTCGVIALAWITRDAMARLEYEERRIQMEQMNVLVRDAQLSALRARIRPHFIFNALTSIAGLCGIDPRRAEAAIVSLSQMMRRSIDGPSSNEQPVRDELDYVRAYLEIEQYRLGSRLRTELDVDPKALSTMIPSFSIQTLVENAVIHGIAPRRGQGTVTLRIRSSRRGTVVGVSDSGLGFEVVSWPEWSSSNEHGLGIVNGQLLLLHGKRARIRIFSRLGVGTLAVFMIPKVT